MVWNVIIILNIMLIQMFVVVFLIFFFIFVILDLLFTVSYFLSFLTYQDCPSITAISSDVMKCRPTQDCTGVRCCTLIDIVITHFYVDAFLAVDPCSTTISVGLGSWNHTETLVSDIWSLNTSILIKPTLRLR